MSNISKKQTSDQTEARIKKAARDLFTRKGYEATKTREIAEKSGINLALLNYYFRSKQNLYDIIMEENMTAFRSGIIKLFGDTEMEIHEKIEKIVHYYIDEFIKNRDLPAFIISTIHRHQHQAESASGFYQSIAQAQRFFTNQIRDHLQKNGNTSVHPAHIIANLMSMTLFPFTIGPILKNRAGLSDKDLTEMLKERKLLIPIWLKSMLDNPKNSKLKKKKR